MANLYLTHKCRRGCPFCFARKVLAQAKGNLDELLTVNEVRTLLDRFGKHMPVVGLLGGEPFLYPHLEELLALLRERHILAKIFTSGTDPLPPALQDLTLEDALGRVCFVVNVGTRDTYTDAKFANLEALLGKFAPICTLSYTIFDLDADPGYILDMIERYDLNRDVRVGIALPIYNGGNQYIPLEDYKRAGQYYVDMALRAAERGITLSMDCGFVACMFTTEQIGTLIRLGGGMNYVCGAAIDIGPRLETWNCFPLFQMGRVDAMQANSFEELQQMLDEQNRRMLGSVRGVFPECDDCQQRRMGQCEGGCKSFKSLIANPEISTQYA